MGLERARQVLVHDQRCWVFLLTATYVVAFVALRNDLVLYSQFGGFTVSAAGLLLGLKQAAPEEEVRPNPQSQGLRYKYLPLVFLASRSCSRASSRKAAPFYGALRHAGVVVLHPKVPAKAGRERVGRPEREHEARHAAAGGGAADHRDHGQVGEFSRSSSSSPLPILTPLSLSLSV